MHQICIRRDMQKLRIRDNKFHENGSHRHQCEVKSFEGSKTENIVESDKRVGESSCELYPKSSMMIDKTYTTIIIS